MISGFWRTVSPEAWPAPPKRFSFSTLADIEDCPRRWALKHGVFTQVWDGSGYPERPSAGALLGRVAHMAIERVSRALNRAGEWSPEAAVRQLRLLGGLTSVIRGCISDEINGQEQNPRCQDRAEATRAQLDRHVPELRLTVQSALNRLVDAADVQAPRTQALQGSRHPLGAGYHPEVMLAPETLEWIGYPDVIRLSSDRCEIIDYKTSEPKPWHIEQVRLYALLWARDRVLNPSARLATTLFLVYQSQTVEVAGPDEGDLGDLETQLRPRVEAAKTALGLNPPTARVGPETCRNCDVKHLCDDYWQLGSQAKLAVQPELHVRSVQALVNARRGDRVVSLFIERDPYTPPGTSGLMRSQDPNHLRPGQHVRLLEVAVTRDTNSDSVIVTYTSRSEAFVVG